jgi:hypothetical protein
VLVALKTWALRLTAFGGIALLCLLANSGSPAFAFVIAWGPNYPLFGAAMIGVLRLPSALEPVHPLEPVLYGWVGVALVKRLVTTRAWLMLAGLESPPRATSRHALLDRTDLMTKGAEVCHGAAFLFASVVALLCLSLGWVPGATWTMAFNIALNGYPIMLQRSNRWRLQRLRTSRMRAS